MKSTPKGPPVVALYVVICPVLLMQLPPVFRLNCRLQLLHVAMPLLLRLSGKLLMGIAL